MSDRDLPATWTEVALRDVTLPIASCNPTHTPSQRYAYVDIGSIDNARQIIAQPKQFIGADAPSRARRPIHEGDVLFSTVRPYLKNIAKVPAALEDALTSTGVTVLRTNGAVLPDYLFRFVCADAFVRTVGGAMDGTLYPAVRDTDVLDAKIALPPLNEQRRIVAKLEDLLARSRRAKDALDGIPPLLETLRRSILAAAFRGDLTADWRSKHREVEPADRLLARIRIERRTSWEQAELVKMVARGKPPGDDRWKEKYTPAQPVDAATLSSLPASWCWASAEELTRDPITYGVVQPGPEDANGVPFVRAMDMEDDKLLLDQIRCISPTIAAAYPRTRLELGDVLLGIVRAAKIAVVPPALVGGNVVRGIARLAPNGGVSAEYLAGVLASPDAQARLLAKHRGIDMPVINIADVRSLPVPLAPFEEQEAIAKLLGRWRRCVAEEKIRQGELARALEQCDAAVHAKAFRGELVVQNPNDESAGRLLARISAERSAVPGKAGRAKPRVRPMG